MAGLVPAIHVGKLPKLKRAPKAPRTLSGCAMDAPIGFRKIYDLHDNLSYVAQVQQATVESLRFGVVPEFGLFGSTAWWKAVDEGRIPTHSVTGQITRVYMGSMNDWPEFAMACDDGSSRTWSQFGTVPEAEDAYKVGRRIRIDYVKQKPKSVEIFEFIDEPLYVWAAEAA
jgi:hypothetical protein